MSLALPRPRGLTWTVLRLHRIALWLWAGYVVVAAGVLLWLWGPGTNGLSVNEPCGSGDAEFCAPIGPTAEMYKSALALVDVSLSTLPLVIAVFAGGVLFGRELERGTAQLAWTQSVTPFRWLVAKLAVPALFLTAGTATLLALRRAVAAAEPGLSDNQWWTGPPYNLLGTTVIAFPLLGLACGALGAVLQRKAGAAAAFSGVLLILLAFCADMLRPHLWPTRTVTGGVHEGYLSFRGEVTGDGAITGSGAHVGDPLCVGDTACLSDHDITGFYTEGHPPSHFWPLQLTETALLLALTAVTVALTYRILKRRVAV